TRSSGEHGELRVEALQVQLAHHRVVALLHEEETRPGLQLLLDELEFALREAEALLVFGRIGIGVGKENLGRGLLDDRAGDGAAQGIARALRRRAEHPVELAPDLQAILRELLERGIGEEPRELVRPAHETPPVQERPDYVKEIERDGSAGHLVVEELRDIRSEERRARDPTRERVRRVVERPGVIPTEALAPPAESRVNPVGARRVRKLDEPREAARCDLEGERPAQRLIEI